MRKKVDCPFCEGDGCCFCDHAGKIFVGPKEMIKSEEGLNSIGVKYLKDSDSESQLESWPEMFEFFLDDINTPDEIIRNLNKRLIESLSSVRPRFNPKVITETTEFMLKETAGRHL